MIISRIVARRRVAAGVRPGWIAAWGLVALDALLLAMVFALVLPPVLGALAGPDWVVIVVLFVLVFVPLQIVLIVSSMWAAKSRWIDLDHPESPM
jgi:hypothetical protein